jgi:hypothetical protein
MEAVENIAKALADQKKKRGTKRMLTERDPSGRAYRAWRGELVELDAAEIVAACKAVAEPDQVVKDLLAGSETALKQSRVESKFVTIFADDAWHLLDCVGASATKRAPMMRMANAEPDGGK